ncbi:MAG: ATP synthase F1 subunit gamma [Deltaproteobacteria bacterium]|nr:ATP synthase F1 subunit gamma [Deltaproteobacteria bacterium]MBW2416015.1 ATP synthase F1 subunit gamma [Deltaproteobacteria bacterium]
MATIRDLRGRIVAVQKTQKITRAMKMVAAAKLARATRQIQAARPYAEKLRQVVSAVAGGVETDIHPLLQARDEVRTLEIVLFTSDRGLCGAYNSNLAKLARGIVDERAGSVSKILLTPVGRRGGGGFRRDRRVSMDHTFTGLGNVNPGQAREIADDLMRRYREGEVDEVILVYSEFKSALTQRPGQERLLPLQPEHVEDAAGYEIEPDPARLLALLIPRAVEFAVYRALLENQAGEHGARMTAMDSATTNTEELIGKLTLDMNKARQAAITAELVEIVSGAEAL